MSGPDSLDHLERTTTFFNGKYDAESVTVTICCALAIYNSLELLVLISTTVCDPAPLSPQQRWRLNSLVSSIFGLVLLELAHRKSGCASVLLWLHVGSSVLVPAEVSIRTSLLMYC